MNGCIRVGSGRTILLGKKLKGILEDLGKRYRVSDGRRFRLKQFAPEDTGPFGRDDEEAAGSMLGACVDQMAELQDKLYAQDRWSLLLIFQAMDAAGKDSTIKQVMSGINPQGCQVFSFKAPSEEELDHDYLWRVMRCLPERGRIGIFNRSYYEETLVVQVHPEILERQHLPPALVTRDIWRERYEDISAYERYLSRNGFRILKFFLNVSKGEQKRRFSQRLEQPSKNWKFSEADLRERERWDDYMAAYETTIRHTASPHAPWFVVPADNKWFTRLVVASVVVETMKSMDLRYPRLTPAQRDELERARGELAHAGKSGAKRKR